MMALHFPPIRWPATLLLAAGLCGCAPPPPVKIGFIGGFTGRLSDLAVDGHNGAQLAVETLVARGEHYELVVHDNAHQVDGGIAAVDAAADEGDAFAIGPMTSVLALGMLPEMSRRRLVMISPTANADELAGRDDYFFRVITPARSGAELLAEAAIRRRQTRVVALMDWHNRSYTEGFAKAFEARFEALGGAPVASVHYETDRNPDYGAIAAQVLASRPQLVLLVSSAVDASIAAQQLRRRAPEVRLAVASWAANVQLLQLGGHAVEGALVLQTLDLASRSPAYLDFLARYQARFGTVPGQAAVYSYQAVMLGVEALRRTTPAHPLREVLAVPGRWPGLLEPVELDRFGDNQSRYHLSEIREGRFVMLPS